jgi:hypothetical protein
MKMDIDFGHRTLQNNRFWGDFSRKSAILFCLHGKENIERVLNFRRIACFRKTLAKLLLISSTLIMFNDLYCILIML